MSLPQIQHSDIIFSCSHFPLAIIPFSIFFWLSGCQYQLWIWPSVLSFNSEGVRNNLKTIHKSMCRCIKPFGKSYHRQFEKMKKYPMKWRGTSSRRWPPCFCPNLILLSIGPHLLLYANTQDNKNHSWPFCGWWCSPWRIPLGHQPQ